MYIRILENDDWIVEYDAENNRYRVSYFQDCHFVDDVLFDTREWIPVSERLPEDEQVVMVCKNDDICIRRYRYDVNLKRGFWHELSDDWGGVRNGLMLGHLFQSHTRRMRRNEI